MNTNTHGHLYDVVIIGGGPAGCSAALTLARCRRKIVMLDDGNHRNTRTKEVHMFLTRDGISPEQFLKLAHAELASYAVERVKARAVKVKAQKGLGFTITDRDGNKYTCRKLLLATGVTDEIPAIPGMAELWGRSVYHCPYCDGWEYADKTIGLYSPHKGYGMTLALRQLSDKVVLFTDGHNYLRPKQHEQLLRRNVQVISTPLRELQYNTAGIKNVILTDGTPVPVHVLFVNSNHTVNNQLLQQLGCKCVKKGAAITNRKQETSIKGVYAAGDASFDMHLVIVAAAEGAKAAITINNALLKEDNELA